MQVVLGIAVLAAAMVLTGCGNPQAPATSSNPVTSATPVREPIATAPGAPTPATIPPGTANQRIYIDPATGRHREPTVGELAAQARERAALKAGVANRENTVVEQALPGGGAKARLDEKFDRAVQLCKQSDGSFGTDCPAPSASR